MVGHGRKIYDSYGISDDQRVGIFEKKNGPCWSQPFPWLRVYQGGVEGRQAKTFRKPPI